MLASAEPEAMKSTAAIGDPSAFLEVNSTTEYIDQYRDSTSLPLVLDDLERDKKQKDMLVGSLNAANKYTVGRGKMQSWVEWSSPRILTQKNRKCQLRLVNSIKLEIENENDKESRETLAIKMQFY